MYESGDWRVRAGYSFQYVLSEFPIQRLQAAVNNPLANLFMPGVGNLAPYLSIKNTAIHFYSLGGAYDDGTWLAQAEASYIDTQTALVPDVASAYLSVGRRFSNVTLYTLFGIAENFHKNVPIPKPLLKSPLLQQLEETLDYTLNQKGINQKSVSLGLRWDFYTNMAFKVQWTDFFLGDNNSAGLWQKSTSGDLPQHVNLWSIGIDFVF